MSEWLTFVKAYALKNNIPYKQALTAASPSYKTRNEIKADVIHHLKHKHQNENILKRLNQLYHN